MYGYYVVEDENSDPNNPTYSQLRFVDTDWIDGIHTAEEKYYGLSGKKTHDLNTVAGTLNTLHDRLGQIVCHLEEIPAQSQINNLSFNCIYEANNAFYRRGIKYRKITVGDDIYLVDRNAGEHFQNDTYYLYGGTDDYGNPIYTIANNYSADNTYYYKTAWCTYDEDLDAEHHFTTNKYYVLNGSNQYVPCQDTVYNPNQSYYLKNINRSRYTEIELTRYYPGEFYFLDGENYICDYHEPDPSDSQRTYYTITSPTSKTFTAGYESEKYYKLDEETGIYIRDDSLVPDPLDNRPYYDLNNTSYITTPQPCIFYAPNQFYYEEKDNLGTYYLATWETIDSTYTSINKVAKDNNCNEISRDLVLKNYGNNKVESAELFFPDLTQDKAFELLDESDRLNIENLTTNGGYLYPGLEDALFNLHQDYDLYIVSNTATKKYIESFLISSKLFKYFKDYVAASEIILSKGNALIKLMDDYYIKDAIYVGDTLKDRKAAEVASIPFIQCLYGFGEDLNCKYKINDISELYECVNNVFKENQR